MDEIFERVKAFIRGEVAAGSVEVARALQRDKGNIHTGWSGGQERIRGRNDEVVASGLLAHLVKDILQGKQRNRGQGHGNVKVINMVGMGGKRKRPYKMEESRVIEEITFSAIPRNSLTDALIILEGTIESVSRVKSSTPRTDRPQGDYRRARKKQDRTAGVCHSKMLLPLQCHHGEDEDEKPQSNDHPDQPIVINGKLSIECKQKLVEVLQKNVDVFTWTLMVSTIVPQFVMEHQLKAYPLAEPMIHKKCPLNPDQRRVLKGKVFEWLKAGIIRKVQYPKWVANAMPVNQRDVTWQVHIDFSRLNKVCPKDIYPFLEIEDKLQSLVGHRY
ncbi:hypothetical protein Tco_0497697 [Tanacetum coccineum]